MGQELPDYILDAERHEIHLRRAAQLGDDCRPPTEDNLVGLSISGGGIRSATFNLGVLQALADYRLLRRIDYLSTVSGGGYIGSWLAAFIRREQSLVDVEAEISPLRRGYQRGPEAKQITHLRSYSNYLTPALGLFSLDGWTLVAIYLRNVLVNQALLLAPVVVLLCALRWGVQGVALVNAESTSGEWPHALSAVRVVFALLTAGWLLDAMYRLHQLDSLDRGAMLAAFGNTRPRLLLWLAPAGILAPIALGVWNAAEPTDTALAAFTPDSGFSGRSLAAFVFTGAVLFAIVRSVVACGGVIALFLPMYHRFVQWAFGAGALRPGVKATDVAGEILLSILAGALGGGSLYLGLNLFLWQVRAANSWLHPLVTVGWTSNPASLATAEALALVTFGPPVYLGCLLLASFTEVWLRGSWIRKIGMTEGQREWWSRANAWLMFVTGLWLATCLIVFYLPVALEYAAEWAHDYSDTLTLATFLGWIGTVGGGLWAGQSVATGAGGGNFKELIARAAPVVFLIGIFTLASTGVSLLIDLHYDKSYHGVSRHFESIAAQMHDPEVRLRFQWVLWTAVSLSVILSLVDANIFSLNSLYANRLTRCYLGASYRNRFDEVVAVNRRGRWNAFTGFDPDDDVRFDDLRGPEIPLRESRAWYRFLRRPAPRPPLTLSEAERMRPELIDLRAAIAEIIREGKLRILLKYLGTTPSAALAPSSVALTETVVGLLDKGCTFLTINDLIVIELRALMPQGPLHIINTALNLAGGGRLEWQERKADSFFFSSLFGGSASTGYQRMPSGLREFTLGRAVAVSGSAVNPNMGYHTTPAVAALLTMFNVRLGWWMHNPARAAHWDIGALLQHVLPSMRRWDPEKGPAGSRLLLELAGLTSDASRFVQLSDGGHFENLGVYELVRRRCRYIIACDAGADPRFEFFDLASTVRKCREDLGVPIEIDVTELRPGSDGLSKWHVAIGEIRYDMTSPQSLPGILIYLKASLTGDEPADVLNYKRQDEAFPHQTTLDQFFSETQFESYRALGYHAAQQVFRDFNNFTG